ncbi:MAG: VWA domain-containing protein [Spirochaetes bacterium]|nr:VWA domain-containing protein [Spirochaetota bacterium]MBU1080387.1 VWA domain-containing protein [Spirochaetota bacterium]
MKRLLALGTIALVVTIGVVSCSSVDSEARPTTPAVAADDGAPSDAVAGSPGDSPKEAGDADYAAAPVPSPAVRSEESASPSLMFERGASKSALGASGSPGAPGSGPRTAPTTSGLKAGFSDDNAQFGYFVDFLKKYEDVPHYPYDISERLTARVVDSAGKPVANATVTVAYRGRTLASGRTFSDGAFRFYPAALGTRASSFDLRARSGSQSVGLSVSRDGPRLVELKMPSPRAVPDPLPLDVLFVMDTTGSMGEEIARLKATMEIIHDNLSGLKPMPLVRFGLVLYKDRGDEYVTEVSPFTSDIDAFRAALDPVSADGGGDGPEDLESALDDAIHAMDWNEGGVRLAFVVTDAEAHLDYGREYTYVDAANDARAKAIKLFTIGTGGLPLEGEYLLRQIAQLSDARYIFLTYGERGESEGGSEGSVSHHTGSNFQTDKLEAIIIRFVKEEVANLSDAPLSSDEDYFSAQKVGEETRDETLGKLFSEAIASLADYSTFHIAPETPCAILPVSAAGDGLGSTAEYFGERLAMASAEAKRWKPVERKDLQKILAELELQLSGLVDEGSAAKVGKLLGADLLVSSTLYRRGGQYELFLRLVRVSTAEVLSVSRAKIALDLGL